MGPAFPNFTADLLALENDADANAVFDAVIPQKTRDAMRNNHPFWRDFISPGRNPDGRRLLERLGRTLT